MVSECCERVIARYVAILGHAEESAALYCPTCHARLVYRAGVWAPEEP